MVKSTKLEYNRGKENLWWSVEMCRDREENQQRKHFVELRH